MILSPDPALPGPLPQLRNMHLLVQLRWMAVAGQVLTIGVAAWGFGIALPLAPMAAVLVLLALFNQASQWYWRAARTVSDRAMFLALLVDVAVLTAELQLSGGLANPFVFVYLLQAVLAAVLLRARTTWALLGITGLCLGVLALAARPLPLPLDPSAGLRSPYVQGLLVCLALDATLLVYLVRRISDNLRARDAHLAALRQRAAEEEHIVRMGLLASGAAHELGTPLSTLSVILGDWAHLPHFSSDPELLVDVQEMQAQVQRCKGIVSGILQSAGEARGESAEETTLHAFLDELAAQWHGKRLAGDFDYGRDALPDARIVSDSALKQMVGNVLDNAAEASPHWVSLQATREVDDLLLRVQDRGPGFAPDILTRLGKPYNSSKGRPGGGLGLFLAMNVARQLGGSLAASNRPEGGAEVVLRLPLAAITLDGRAASSAQVETLHG